MCVWCVYRWNYTHKWIGPYTWALPVGERKPGDKKITDAEKALHEEGKKVNDELMKLVKPAWDTFAKECPKEAADMLRAKEEAGMALEDGISGTGWTGGYIGSGSTLFHLDPECIGLTTVIPLAHNTWVYGSYFVVPEAGHAFTMTPGALVFCKTHEVWHGSTLMSVRSPGHMRLVVSLFCRVDLITQIQKQGSEKREVKLTH